MNFFESHFWYNKRQRNGILILTGLILGLQTLLYFSEELFAPEHAAVDLGRLERMNRQLDSILESREGPRKPRIYPFNPNYLTDLKGYLLGMTPSEIDRLLAFREKGRFIRSSSEFQEVTGISDSLLLSIEPHFRFPAFKSRNRFEKRKPTRETVQKMDLNRATEEDLQEIYGVGKVLSRRIVAYRRSLKGYSLKEQLYEVYNLPDETVDLIFERFEIQEAPSIQKLDVNRASFRELLSLPYVDYDLTRRIVKFRQEEKVISDLADLKKIDSFPLDKYERIALYLSAE